jgi:hypothetical protein
MNASARVALLCLAWAGLATRTAIAQPTGPVLYESIEARVAGAESVFRGSICGLTRAVIVPEGGRATNYTTEPNGVRTPHIIEGNPNGEVNYAIQVKVEEVLKGPPRTNFAFVEEKCFDFDRRWDQWAEQRTPFLWFVGGSRTAFTDVNTGQYTAVPNSGWSNIRLGKAVPAEKMFTKPGLTVSSDFTCLTEPEEVLKRAREFAKEWRGPVKVHVYQMPPLSCGSYWAQLAVPIVPSLEKTAQRLIRSPAEFFPDTMGPVATNAEQRRQREFWLEYRRSWLPGEGIGALQYFKSAENIALLMPFLTNSLEGYSEIYEGDLIGTKVRHYPLRASAYAVLKNWGVAVSEPVVQEQIPPVATPPSLEVWIGDGSPAGVAVDSQGNLFVSNAGNSVIRKLTLVGTNWVVSLVGGSDNGEPSSRHEHRACTLALDQGGNVYVADSYRSIIQRYTARGTNWVGAIIAGRTGYKGTEDGTNSAVRFNEPYGIAVDKAGNVYVADAREDTIRRIAPSGTNWVVTTIAGDPSKKGWWVEKNRDRRISYPQGVAVDSESNILVANQGDKDVMKVAQAAGKWNVHRIAGGDWNVPEEKRKVGVESRFEPWAIAADGEGRIYLGDWNFGNSMIWQLTPNGKEWVTACIAGPTRREAKENKTIFADGAGHTARFNCPQGLAVDHAGDIYVADTGNCAIRKLTRAGDTWVATTIIRGVRSNP